MLPAPHMGSLLQKPQVHLQMRRQQELQQQQPLQLQMSFMTFILIGLEDQGLPPLVPIPHAPGLLPSFPVAPNPCRPHTFSSRCSSGSPSEISCRDGGSVWPVSSSSQYFWQTILGFPPVYTSMSKPDYLAVCRRPMTIHRQIQTFTITIVIVIIHHRHHQPHRHLHHIGNQCMVVIVHTGILVNSFIVTSLI